MIQSRLLLYNAVREYNEHDYFIFKRQKDGELWLLPILSGHEDVEYDLDYEFSYEETLKMALDIDTPASHASRYIKALAMARQIATDIGEDITGFRFGWRQEDVYIVYPNTEQRITNNLKPEQKVL